MIAMWLTTLALLGAANAPGPPVTLAVLAPPDVRDSLVNRICTEAEAIWNPAGIPFDCHRHAATDDTTPWTIEVTVDDRPTPIGRDGALGWIEFSNEGADRSIHLARASAEALLRGTPSVSFSTTFWHETLMGRALGRALAHELGHYVFQSKLHTRRGLMRPDWSADETFGLSRKGFALTSQQQATAVECLWTALEGDGIAPRGSSW